MIRATFYIDEHEWREFLVNCKRRNVSASSQLRQYVHGVLMQARADDSGDATETLHHKITETLESTGRDILQWFAQSPEARRAAITNSVRNVIADTYGVEADAVEVKEDDVGSLQVRVTSPAPRVHVEEYTLLTDA